MAILTSRPAPPPPAPSKQDLVELVTPAVGVLHLLTSNIRLPDDSQGSVSRAYELIEDALDCFKFPDYSVMAMPSLFVYELVYDVAIRPISGGSWIVSKVIFRVQP